MTGGAEDGRRQLWLALNVVGLVLVVGYGGAFALLVVLLGTDHSESYVDEWAPRWAVGAVVGLLTALLAGRYDRRYLPWTAGLGLAGLLGASLAGLSYLAAPFVPVGPLLAVSVVLHARAGRDRARVPNPRRQRWTGVLVTGATLTVVGAATVFVAVASRSTPLYDAMRADPMAADKLPGMVVRFDHSKDQTKPLGMPSPAQVSRLWTITDGSAVAAKLDELEGRALRTGWTEGPDRAFCGWQKVVDEHPLCLVLRPGPGAGEVIVEITPTVSQAGRSSASTIR